MISLFCKPRPNLLLNKKPCNKLPNWLISLRNLRLRLRMIRSLSKSRLRRNPNLRKSWTALSKSSTRLKLRRNPSRTSLMLTSISWRLSSISKKMLWRTWKMSRKSSRNKMRKRKHLKRSYLSSMLRRPMTRRNWRKSPSKSISLRIRLVSKRLTSRSNWYHRLQPPSPRRRS
jgi:hypothetical protein